MAELAIDEARQLVLGFEVLEPAAAPDVSGIRSTDRVRD
jgi:hypothetical protein